MKHQYRIYDYGDCYGLESYDDTRSMAYWKADLRFRWLWVARIALWLNRAMLNYEQARYAKKLAKRRPHKLLPY